MHNKKGAALVVTLAIVAILVAAALQLGKFAGESAMASLKGKDLFQAEQYALSGINLAMLILLEDAGKNTIDSIQEPWANSDILEQTVSEMGLDNNRLTIKITDELSKIQINALLIQFPGNQINMDQNNILEKLFSQTLSDDDTREQLLPISIINCVKDWLDSLDDDAITGISGAESDYYLGLDSPYVCANAPFNHIDELMSVKGIAKDLLKNDNNIDDVDENDQQLEFENIFTVYGLNTEVVENNKYQYVGKVNLNTANLDVIKALLPEGMEKLGIEIVDFRSQKSENGDLFVNSLDKGWYKKVIDLSQKEQKKFERVISYSSNIFKVECVGKENNSKVKLACWIERKKQKESGKWICKIIQIERK